MTSLLLLIKKVKEDDKVYLVEISAISRLAVILEASIMSIDLGYFKKIKLEEFLSVTIYKGFSSYFDKLVMSI